MSAVLADVPTVSHAVPLAEAVEFNPKPQRGSIAEDLEVSFVPMAAVEAGSGLMDATRARPYADVKKGFTYFCDDDVLFAKITPCMENGKMAVAYGLRNGIGFGSTEFHVLRPREGVDARYVFHFVSSAGFRREAAHHMTGAVGQKRVPLSFLQESNLPLPPINEQRRIVADIEKQFSRLDEAVANLQRVKANLKRIAAATLKAAIEGSLVRNESEVAARTGTNYESANELLDRVLTGRRNGWTGRGKWKEPRAIDAAHLPPLPVGWTWSTFEVASDRVTVGHVGSMKDEYVAQGVPFLRSQNVRPNRFDAEGLKYISPAFHKSLAKSLLRPGDIAVVRSGSVGVSCVIPDSMPESNCSDLVIIKNPTAVLAAYGAYYLNAVVESRIAAGRVGVALVHFNTQSVAELPLPVPPLAEQRRIVAEVDRRLSIVREVETEVDANLKRAKALRQAVLARAFQSA